MDKIKEEIIINMPLELRENLGKCDFSNLEEIRFRVGRPVMLYYTEKKYFLSKNSGVTSEINDARFFSPDDILKLVCAFCKNSVYAYQEEIREGFITISGGHRVGIAGKAVTDEGKLKNIDSFSGVNIRIAREFKDSADGVINHIYKGKRIYNSVIISPPGVGKTTVLRDIARRLSEKFKVVILDERSELAASKHGVPQFDVGYQTDVLDGFSKKDGINIALRSLSPDVIITDETGTLSDIEAVVNILKGGCKIVTSMHGYSIEEAIKNKKQLMELFETAVLIKRDKDGTGVEKCLRLWE